MAVVSFGMVLDQAAPVKVILISFLVFQTASVKLEAELLSPRAQRETTVTNWAEPATPDTFHSPETRAATV
jgi:hypothetical protein